MRFAHQLVFDVEARIREAGYFAPRAVAQLFEKCRKGNAIGFADNMAFVGVLSTMLLHESLVRTLPTPDSAPARTAETLVAIRIRRFRSELPRVVRAMSSYGLSFRQREVALLLARGEENRAIASRLSGPVLARERRPTDNAPGSPGAAR
jgi:ATP/maltotriose-dependent transcriptional regulator MalT